MKNLLLPLCLIFVISCGNGKDNQPNPGTPTSDSKTENIEIPRANPSINFEGTYEIIQGLAAINCPATINITKECNGYVLTSSTNQDEDFCDVNVDRHPQSPDGNNEVEVTQEANQLKSVVKVGQYVLTNLLTLHDDIYLTKMTDYKSHSSIRCVFQKR